MRVVGIRVQFLSLKLGSPCAPPWVLFFPEAVISNVWKVKVSSITLSQGIHLLMDKLSRRWGSRARWHSVNAVMSYSLSRCTLNFLREKNPIKLSNYSRTTKATASVIRNFFHTFFQGLLSTLGKLSYVNIITIVFVAQIKSMWMN